MEELCDVCRSTDDVIGCFLSRREQLRRNWRGPFTTFVLPLHNFSSQARLHQDMLEIRAKIGKVFERRHSAVRRAYQDSPWTVSQTPRRSTASFVPEEPALEGFEDDVDAIMEVLLKDDARSQSISIVGAAGIGKTCLAKLIYHHHATAANFPFRAWVPYDPFMTLEDIVEKVTSVKLWKQKRIVRWGRYDRRTGEMLSTFLMEKKSLIIFDEASSDDCKRSSHLRESLRDELIRIFDETSNGSRIIFTSRQIKETSEDVPERNHVYRLHLRTDDESWALFIHTLKVNMSTELLGLKGEVVRKCGGLPLAIVSLGHLLSHADATVQSWSRALDEFILDDRPWSQILHKLDRNLPLYLRRLLFYFGLFPQDFEVPARRLIVLWVAEGLVPQKSEYQPLEYFSERCLMELVNRNMVQVSKKKLNGKVKACRLPHALRVHWLSKAKEANFLHTRTNVNPLQPVGIIRRLADHLDHSDPSFAHIHGTRHTTSLHSYRDTISFLSFDTRQGSKPGEDIGNFLDRCISSMNFHYLHVLDLENVFKPKLPKAIGKLLLLRYLGLRWTCLEMLPSFINKLLSLQTLDLKHTCINMIPTSIWNMKQLRHLFLNETHRGKFVPRPRGQPSSNLQTLCGVFVDEESPVTNGLDTLINLRKLGLSSRLTSSQQEPMLSQLDAVANWVSKLRYLQYLRLKSFDEFNQPWNIHVECLSRHNNLSTIYLLGELKHQQVISKFPPSLVEITLSASGLMQDPMQALAQLPNLEILRLLSNSYLGKRMICSANGFKKLRVLKFWKLEVLEEFVVEEGGLAVLKDLEIRCCQNLKMLPDALQYVETLRELKLQDMPAEFTFRIADHLSQDWYKIAHIRHVYIENQ
ncbi:LOW QUALITY PROTEIN: probable disease resistance RPP8-like protein 2 [Carica papaya]|uniref:LOW QUALITY PROTEIN: probable disease resistance RPP8-like protein 2 n=1 Tax=Carica papaya TaxID=3649 RepID=UPI000B8CF924|nr:LOW QUALITY PROTEIN: probable disease resistance RPP8-like protein 2 [Carica papaya]